MNHGDHWEAITGSAEDAIKEWLPALTRHGRLIGTSVFSFDDGENPPRLEKCAGLVHPEGPLRFIGLVCTDSLSKPPANVLFSAFPYLSEGNVHAIQITGIEEDESNEGVIEGSVKGDASVSFFDPLYFLNKTQYRPGTTANFTIAALAYVLRRCEKNSIEVTGGPLLEMERERVLEKNPDTDVNEITSVPLSLERACWMMPREVNGDFEFRGIPESVECLKVGEQVYYKLEMVAMRPDDEDFRITLYVFEAVLKNYVPKVGEAVEGVLWLQGTLVRDAEEIAVDRREVSLHASNEKRSGFFRKLFVWLCGR